MAKISIDDFTDAMIATSLEIGRIAKATGKSAGTARTQIGLITIKIKRDILHHTLWVSGFSDRAAREIADKVPQDRLLKLSTTSADRSLEIICQIHDIIELVMPQVRALDAHERAIKKKLESTKRSNNGNVRRNI